VWASCGISTATIVRILDEFGPLIFSNPQPDGRLKLLLWAAKCAGKAANSSDPLRAALEKGFENKTIGEIHSDRRIALCIPASRLLDWSPKVFKTPHFKHSRLNRYDWSSTGDKSRAINRAQANQSLERRNALCLFRCDCSRTATMFLRSTPPARPPQDQAPRNSRYSLTLKSVCRRERKGDRRQEHLLGEPVVGTEDNMVWLF